MGFLQKFVKGIGKNKEEFKAKLKEAQEEEKIARIVEERNKSANERDLENRLEKKRQEKIKEALDKLRKEDSKEMWKSKKSILDKGTSILRDERPILKEKNIFTHGKYLFNKRSSKKHSMGFFK